MSSTVTVAEQVVAFPIASVTVKTTELVPRSPQAKVEGDTDKERLPEGVQLSVEPLLICPAVIEAVPLALSWTVIFWQLASGGTVSSTVTLDMQVEVFPLPSVTVIATMLLPRLLQLNVEGETEKPRLPPAVQLSVEPLFTIFPVMEAVPDPFNWTVIS